MRTANIQKVSCLAQTLFELSQKNDRVGSQIDPPLSHIGLKFDSERRYSPEQRNPNRKYLISELGVHILHCGNQANF